MNVTRILYRGSLSSCNYACSYCPFAKTTNSKEELALDRLQLNRFSDWVETAARPVGIFITPWGEAIIHRYYREAMVRLSRLQHVHRVVLQTNLSGHLDDLSEGDAGSIAIWATFHPGETSSGRFLFRCETLRRLGIRYSVGMVGLREHFASIEELRSQLPQDVYLWINAPKSSGIVYSADELDFLTSVDPYFRWNTQAWPSFGKPCQTGDRSFTVDGDGDVRRCHFVQQVLGNIYANDVWPLLQPRTCPNNTCGCHIGYVNRDDFQMDEIYGENMLERIPSDWPNLRPERLEPKLVQFIQ